MSVYVNSTAFAKGIVTRERVLAYWKLKNGKDPAPVANRSTKTRPKLNKILAIAAGLQGVSVFQCDSAEEQPGWLRPASSLVDLGGSGPGSGGSGGSSSSNSGGVTHVTMDCDCIAHKRSGICECQVYVASAVL